MDIATKDFQHTEQLPESWSAENAPFDEPFPERSVAILLNDPIKLFLVTEELLVGGLPLAPIVRAKEVGFARPAMP